VRSPSASILAPSISCSIDCVTLLAITKLKNTETISENSRRTISKARSWDEKNINAAVKSTLTSATILPVLPASRAFRRMPQELRSPRLIAANPRARDTDPDKTR
jgi:hypothetical protein